MMLADEVGRQAVADPQQMERAKARFLGDVHRKQENVEAIATAANEKIGIEVDAETIEEPQEPSSDWMNAFTREAENASSDELRQRLASILAGEIKRPGTFSRSTLRLVGEIEQKSLAKFQEVLRNRIRDNIYAPQDWSSGDMFMTGIELSELGLISGVGNTNHILKIDPNGKAFMIGYNYGLVITTISPSSLPNPAIWIISRVGLEVASLLMTFDERVPLRAFALEIEKSNVKQIAIGKATPLPNGLVNITNDEFPYVSPVASTVSNPMPSAIIPVAKPSV